MSSGLHPVLDSLVMVHTVFAPNDQAFERLLNPFSRPVESGAAGNFQERLYHRDLSATRGASDVYRAASDAKAAETVRERIEKDRGYLRKMVDYHMVRGKKLTEQMTKNKLYQTNALFESRNWKSSSNSGGWRLNLFVNNFLVSVW